MDKSTRLKIRKEILESFRELTALSNIIDARDKCRMKKYPSGVVSPSEKRILAIKKNPDGTTSKIYTLRKAGGREMSVQSPSKSAQWYSMKEYRPSNEQPPCLPAKGGGPRRRKEFNPKASSTPSQVKRCPSGPNQPRTYASPNYQIYKINPQQSQCRSSPAQLSESVLEEGAWGPKHQSPYPRRVPTLYPNNVDRILRACQNVRGSPIPTSPSRENPTRSRYFQEQSCRAPQSFTEGSESYSGCSESGSFAGSLRNQSTPLSTIAPQSEYDQTSYLFPTYRSLPHGDQVAPICVNRAQGAIPKISSRKEPPGAQPSVSPVNIIFMTPSQLTESGLMNFDKKSYTPLPEANNLSECSQESVLMQQNAMEACSYSESTPRQRTARRKLIFDSCDDGDPETPTFRKVQPACPRCSSKTSKSSKAPKQKSCLKQQKNNQKDDCRCSEDSNDDDGDGDDNEDGNDDDDENGNDDACATNQAPSTPRGSMKKLTVISRKDECGKQINEIIEEDVFSDDCDGEVSVRSIVKGMDPFKYLEKRMAQLENTPFGSSTVPPRNAQKKKIERRCCPCLEKEVFAARKVMSEGSANQTLNEVIDTTLKTYEKIAKVITKRPIFKCLDLPSDRDKLNKLLEEKIERTESSISMLRRDVGNALAELSTIFARRAQKTVPEIEGLIKHFEKRLCSEDPEGQRNSERNSTTASKHSEAKDPTEEPSPEFDSAKNGAQK